MDLKKEIKKMKDEALEQWRSNHHNYWAGYAFACRDLLEYIGEEESHSDTETNLDIKYIEGNKLDSFRKIATNFGLDCQRAKLEEELIELLHATNRINTKSIHDYDEAELKKDFIEEAGDVLMVLVQVIWLMDVGDEVETSVEEKIKRTLQRIFLDKIRENNT